MNAKKSVVLAAAVALACGGSVESAGPGADPSQQGAEVVISPLVANVVTGGMIAFTASVTGLASTAVAWSVEEGAAGGSVDSTGLYSAPSTAGSYHVLVASAADTTKTARATINVTTSATQSAFGTGTTYAPSFVTTVTGGGAMPSTASGYTASCAGDGATDDTTCLRNAAAAAAAQGKPLLIPYTANGYLVSAPINVATSVIGIGGAAPLIYMAGSTGSGSRKIIQISGYQGSGLWITNLHLKGPFTTSAPSGEWDHGIWITNSRNITIKGNLIENIAGDSIAMGQDPNLMVVNVIIDGNTLRNPYRCAVGLVYTDVTWVGNNLIEKPFNYVSAIDFEPNVTPEGCNRAEVAYNKFVMNNRTPGRYGSDGRASSAWQNANVASPGGNLYLHHNYGTFGVGWWMKDISYLGGNGDWSNIVQSSNVEGSTIPG